MLTQKEYLFILGLFWTLSLMGAQSLPEEPPFKSAAQSASLSWKTTASRLQEHVRRLAGDIGERNVWRPKALQAAADYIREGWRSQGYEVSVQGYKAYGIECENLEVIRKGRELSGEIIMVGAHYDSVRGSLGANDNASGVAALLEIGRSLANERLKRTVRLVAFVNEEPPFFNSGEMGSGVYAKAARNRGDDIRVMMSLEMLGSYSNEPNSQSYPPMIGWFYPDTANFIAFVSDIPSRNQLKRTVEAFRKNSTFPSEYLAIFSIVPGVSWSDQLSFWREGYKALMVTDTSFYRYPYYHTAQDTPDKIDYDSMAQVVDGLAGAIIELANDEGDQ